MTTGGGCFKCGSTDHIAMDCTRDATMKRSTKFIMKDNNAQRGGDKARYVLLIAYVCLLLPVIMSVLMNDHNFMV